MSIVKVFKTIGLETNIFPLSGDRDWMPENKYAYNCFPVTLSNKLGYGLSFDHDISFMWNGDSSPGVEGNIEVYDGAEYCFFGRGGGIIGFPTNLIFKTEEDLSILTMPVPNQFIDGVQCFTSVLSSSFYTGVLQVVWKITSPNKVITIPAGTPLAAVLPISVSKIQDTTFKLLDEEVEILHGKEYNDAMFEYGKINNRPSDWYRNETNHLGNKIGSHEVKSLKLNLEREYK
jgi:hypothetical protein